MNDVAVMIGGRAGDGSLASGEILASVFAKMGLEVCTIKDFPSNIRGLPTNYTIRGREKLFLSRKDHIDFLIALDEVAVEQHIGELPKDGVLIYDSSGGDIPEDLKRSGIHTYLAPMEKMAVDNLGGSSGRIFKNLISLGVLGGLIGLDEELLKETVEKMFGRKGKEVVDKNIQAYRMGVEYVSKNLKKTDPYILKRRKKKDKLLITGDEAIGLGALAAGCRFYAGYPITPATEIMEWAAHNFPKYNGVVVQSEDEIAAIHMVIGASYCGARAMTGTSGPGASLMTEAVGLAGMTETPIVIMHGQRAAPGTGLPTKSEQADIEHALYSTHGDFPRIILSPGTIVEAFYFIVEAFNLAERYQCPVILLSEQMLCQNKHTVDKLDLKKMKIDRGKLLTEDDLKKIKDYKRYQFTEDGISPRSMPSLENGLFEANSNEHDEYGGTTEDLETRRRMMRKRLKKLEVAKKDLIEPKVFGDEAADIGIIGMGSTYGPIKTAMEQLAEEDISVKYLQIRMLKPFPYDSVKKFVDSCSRIYVVEHNATGQLARQIMYRLGLSEYTEKFRSILRYDGRGFRPIEIVEGVKRR
ncbi:MAG: 2-oxoacid:acceptor oxidoreductase subunit alpha [Nitrososphaerales archaeon]